MRFLFFFILLGVLSACTATPQPASTPTPGPDAFPDTARLPSPAPATARPTPAPTLPPTPEPAQPAAAVERRNLFTAILGEVNLPPGWTAAPCEGQADALCFFKDERLAGGMELRLTQIDHYPALVTKLRRNGLRPGLLNMRLQRVRETLLAGMRDLAFDHLEEVKQQRRGIYPAGVIFTPQGPLQSQVGALTGVRFGYQAAMPGGETQERVRIYTASDGETVYTLLLAFPDGSAQPFLSADELQQLLPSMSALIAGLKIPLPVEPSEITRITARRDVPIYALYGEGPPVGALQLGASAPVTGLGVDGAYWRVPCPEDEERHCWVPADPAVTQPSR